MHWQPGIRYLPERERINQARSFFKLRFTGTSQCDERPCRNTLDGSTKTGFHRNFCYGHKLFMRGQSMKENPTGEHSNDLAGLSLFNPKGLRDCRKAYDPPVRRSCCSQGTDLQNGAATSETWRASSLVGVMMMAPTFRAKLHHLLPSIC